MPEEEDPSTGKPRRRPGFAFLRYYVDDVATAYRRLWVNYLTGWDGIRTKLDEDKDYSAGRFTGDLIRLNERLWTDSWLLGSPLARWFNGGDRIPTIAFVVDYVAQAAPAKEVLLPIGVNPDLGPFVTAIRPVYSDGLKPRHVDASITEDGMFLRVALRSLKHPEVRPDRYECLICVHDERQVVPLAAMYVVRFGKPHATTDSATSTEPEG